MKELTCPTCKKSVLNVGFYHENNTLSMKCSGCNGLVFPTTKQEEDKNQTLLHGPVVSGHLNQSRELLPIKIAPSGRESQC